VKNAGKIKDWIFQKKVSVMAFFFWLGRADDENNEFPSFYGDDESQAGEARRQQIEWFH